MDTISEAVRSGLIAGLAFAATEGFIIQVSSLAFGDRTPLRSRISVSRDLRSGFQPHSAVV
jgi:hypothetical protein